MNFFSKKRFGHLFGIMMCFVGLAIFVLVERAGVQYNGQEKVTPFLPENMDINIKVAGNEKNCLLIFHSQSQDSLMSKLQMEQIMKDMRVGYDICDLVTEEVPDLESYSTVVIMVSNLDELNQEILGICDWVEEGGCAMLGLPPQKCRALDMISPKLGILESSYQNARIESVEFKEGFLLGGEKEFKIVDSYESSSTVRVSETCKVYAKSGEKNIPLIWSNRYGEGKFVVDNLGFYEKAYRGFHAAAYSLLEDVFMYPVINGSTFYIDDFPSPVPNGDGKFIKRDFKMNISEFYTNIWWPDIKELGEKYNISYTGMIIENYESQTSGTLPRNHDISRYQFFGNMLLSLGGELGFHGYNHQPLCLDNFNYQNQKSYEPWENLKAMQSSIEELSEFSKSIFPEQNFSVYVPPSNILSEEGRNMLRDMFPEIRAIASVYLPGAGEPVYEQEFEISEDGMIEIPRIIAGCDINEYMQMAALSELNFHFVNSHFLHPDDLLDEERGAANGWDALKESFASYLDWLFGAAPDIRNLTGSQMAGAVERYSAIGLWSMYTQDQFYATIDGLYDEAYFIIRVNEGGLGAVKGGQLTRLTDELYLLHALNSEIEIERNR